MSRNIDNVLDAYITAALWTSTDDEGNPLDDVYEVSDILGETVASMREDVESFVEGNETDLTQWSDEEVGHDFWLTRNGHGTGFWDRGRGTVGERLAKAAKMYGESCLYLGDDGRIYV